MNVKQNVRHYFRDEKWEKISPSTRSSVKCICNIVQSHSYEYVSRFSTPEFRKFHLDFAQRLSLTMVSSLLFYPTSILLKMRNDYSLSYSLRLVFSAVVACVKKMIKLSVRLGWLSPPRWGWWWWCNHWVYFMVNAKNDFVHLVLCCST